MAALLREWPFLRHLTNGVKRLSRRHLSRVEHLFNAILLYCGGGNVKFRQSTNGAV